MPVCTEYLEKIRRGEKKKKKKKSNPPPKNIHKKEICVVTRVNIKP